MSQYSVGSRWWKIDFHVHTPESKDFGHGDAAQKNATARDWLKSAMRAGLDAVVVTDHNTGMFVDPLKVELKRISVERPDWYRPLVIFPGVEITVANAGERIHVLAILDPEKDSASVMALLGKCDITDNFGDDENGYTSDSVENVVKAIAESGGIPILAHVDAARGVLQNRTSLSLHLKKWLPTIPAMQVVREVTMTSHEDRQIIEKIAQVGGSDAHVIEDIGSQFSWVKMGRATISALELALHDNSFCVRQGTAADPNSDPSFYIRNVTISKLRRCGRGPFGPLTVDFSPHLTSLIGGRGTGKSTVLECLRHVFQQIPEKSSLPNVVARLREFRAGMFIDGSEISVEFCFHGSLYRLEWSFQDDQLGLQEFSEADRLWHPVETGDIVTRFPIGVYSQKQLYELANDPRGLLAIVDRSDSVNREEWGRRWELKRSEYLQLCVRARELRNRLRSLSPIATQIGDLDKKISEYQSKGYGNILKRMAHYSQQSQGLCIESDLKAAATGIREQAELLTVPDFPDDLFLENDVASNEVRAQFSSFKAKVVSSLKVIVEATKNIENAADEYRKEVDSGEWANGRKQCEAEYEAKALELKAQGDTFNPDLYGRWVAERSRLSAEYAKFDALQQEQKQVLTNMHSALANLEEMRRELWRKRAAFIEAVIGGNPYVRMSVLPFGDMSRLEEDVRNILGLDGDKFATSLYLADERKGILSELINWKEQDLPVDCLPEKISEMKKVIWKGVHGESIGYQLAFSKRLQAIYESNPSAINEISAYWPEDKLEVKYVVDGVPQSLENGSAGQKSAAILAFLLSYGTDPLVLDQPEDDLDNALIMELVVSQMHLNKQKRQLIIATHNPNIVVNGDSEQVCVMKFVNGLITTDGQAAMDDIGVRRGICTIMEGGAEAFRKRYARMNVERLVV